MSKRARFRGSFRPTIETLGDQLLPVVGAGARAARGAVVDVIESSIPRGEIRHTAEGQAYRASAPGQPPASPTGTYPRSWGTTRPAIVGKTVRGSAATDSGIGPELEYGHPGPPLVEPRPHARPALPIAVERIGKMLSEARR